MTNCIMLFVDCRCLVFAQFINFCENDCAVSWCGRNLVCIESSFGQESIGCSAGIPTRVYMYIVTCHSHGYT